MALIVIAAVVAFICFLMLIRVKLIVGFEDKIIFKIKFLFITLRIKEREAGKAKKAHVKAKKKPDLIGILKLIDRFSQVIKDAAASTLKRLRIDRLYIKLIIKEEDPAKTAILYGEACAAVYTVTALLGSAVELKQHEIILKPLFGEGSAQAEFECELSMRIGSIFAVGILQSSAFIKVLLKEHRSKKPAKEGEVN